MVLAFAFALSLSGAFFIKAPVVQHGPQLPLSSRGERVVPNGSNLLLFSSSSSSSSPDPIRRRSRLDGNQREPSPQELAIMDEMITKLANAKPYELPVAVQRAFRVISSPRFFLRIVERIDQCNSLTDKQQLEALASNLVSTLDAVVSTAKDKLDHVAEDVEKVVKAAAEPDSGEFLVPLTEERIAAMRQTLSKMDQSSLDGDAFLSTVDAFMNKSHLDGLDGMVGILQKVLQMYAGRRIMEARAASSSSSSSSRHLFDQLLQTDSDSWDAVIRANVQDAVTAAQLTHEIQRDMETIVLQLDSGSMAQQVQAEYLKEMVKRVQAIEKSLA